MNKNKFCLSKRVVFAGFFVFIVLIIFYLVNIVVHKKQSLSSQAKTPRQSQEEQVITLDNVLTACNISYLGKRYPNFKITENWKSRDNRYSLFGVYMIKWFVNRLNGNITDNPDLIIRAKSTFGITTTGNCGLWEVAMRRLISNYQKGVSPERALNEIRILSSNAIYDNRLLKKNILYLYNNGSSTINLNQAICGFSNIYKRKSCLLFKDIVTQYGLSSAIYSIENQPIPIALYISQQYHQELLAKITPALSDFYQKYPDFSKENVLGGPVFTSIPSALSAIVEPYVLDYLQVQIDQYCLDNPSLSLNPVTFCGYNVHKITDPTYLAQAMVEKNFGINSVSPTNIDLINKLSTLYSAFQIIQQVAPDGSAITLGYDYSRLENESQQLDTIVKLVSGARANYTLVEIEIGYGSVYNPCPSNALCLKIDPEGNPSNLFVSFDKDTLNQTNNFTGFFSLTSHQLAAKNNLRGQVDNIYMVAPYINTDSPDYDYTKLPVIINNAVTLLEPGGTFVIYYSNQLYALLDSETLMRNIDQKLAGSIDEFITYKSELWGNIDLDTKRGLRLPLSLHMNYSQEAIKNMVVTIIQKK